MNIVTAINSVTGFSFVKSGYLQKKFTNKYNRNFKLEYGQYSTAITSWIRVQHPNAVKQYPIYCPYSNLKFLLLIIIISKSTHF